MSREPTPEEIAVQVLPYQYNGHNQDTRGRIAAALRAAEERGRVAGIEAAEKELRQLYKAYAQMHQPTGAITAAQYAIARLKEQPHAATAE